MKRNIIIVTILLMCCGILIVIVASRGEFGKDNKSNVKSYVMSDNEIIDTEYEYKLSYKDINGKVHYLYFTPDRKRTGFGINSGYGNIYSIFRLGKDNTVRIGSGACTICLDNHRIISSEYYLENISKE